MNHHHSWPYSATICDMIMVRVISHSMPTGSPETKGRGCSESLFTIHSSALACLIVPLHMNCFTENKLRHLENSNGLWEASFMEVTPSDNNFLSSTMNVDGTTELSLRRSSTCENVEVSPFGVRIRQHMSTLHSLRAQITTISSKTFSSSCGENPMNRLLNSLTFLSSFASSKSNALVAPEHTSFSCGKFP